LARRTLGKTESQLDAYAKEVVISDLEEPGDEDVIRKVMKDIADAGSDLTDADIRAKLQEFEEEAREQILGDDGKTPPRPDIQSRCKRRPPAMNADLPSSSHGNSLIDAVADWLMNQALGTASLEDLLIECSLRLNAAGVPLWRSTIAFQTLILCMRRSHSSGSGKAACSRWAVSPKASMRAPRHG
jgi:hypothetical protein